MNQELPSLKEQLDELRTAYNSMGTQLFKYEAEISELKKKLEEVNKKAKRGIMRVDEIYECDIEDTYDLVCRIHNILTDIKNLTE